MKRLSDILSNVPVEKTEGRIDINISSINFDSRLIEDNHLFVAVRGTQADGHNFIMQAISNGAVAVVCEDIPGSINKEITYIQVNNSAEALGLIAANYHDNPSEKLKLVGVTGTNGKTTIATLLHRLHQQMGYKCGLLSTIGNVIHTTNIESTHTTPDALQINNLLNEMIDAGCDYCFMEVSSHAIDQYRIAGLSFAGGVFTNITHDHLDYHSTFEEYLKAKKTFFDQLPASAFCLTNNDDRNGKVMQQNTKAVKYGYALKSFAEYKARILESYFDGMQLIIDGTETWTKFIGGFNAYNMLAIYATARLLGHDKTEVLTILSSMKSVAGRFESIRSTDGITAIVDYAHTPDALQNVLKTINDLRTGNEQLITVVGTGGDRDKAKRPQMAKIACDNSDKVILTSDNPRTEKPEDIIADMQKGIDAVNNKKVITIIDRREAIRTSCMLAKPQDIILVAGKGHEDYQEINGVKHHFDDKEVLNEAFNN